MKVGIVEGPDTLNPYATVEGSATTILRDLYDTLVTVDLQQNYVPQLAQSWEHSPDGLTWTFHLKQGVTWHDGVPFTSADVKFSFDLVLSQEIPVPYGAIGFVDSVEAPDDYTVILHLPAPTAVMMYGLNQFDIVPKHIWGSMTTRDEVLRFDNIPVIGNGAFRFVEWKKGQYIRLQAYDNYWLGRPYIDELWFIQYASPETEFAALRTGEIDVMPSRMDPKEISIVDADANLKTDLSPATSSRVIYFSVYDTEDVPPNPALKDVRVRQAFHRSIDKETLNNLIHSGMFVPAFTAIPPAVAKWYDPDLGKKVDMTFNLEAAAQMLDDAGYRDIDHSGIRQAVEDIKVALPDGSPFVIPKGTKLDFGYVIESEYPEEVLGAEMMNQWLHQVGMNIRISMADASILGATELPPYPYDIEVWNWECPADPDFILSVYTTQQIGGWSSGGWSNPKYDQLFEQQRRTIDEDQRREIVFEMQKMIYEESPEIILYYAPFIGAHRIDKFTGWVTGIPGGVIGIMGFEGYPRTTTSVHLIYAPSTTGVTTTTEQPSTIPLATMAVPVLIIIVLLGYIAYIRRKKTQSE